MKPQTFVRILHPNLVALFPFAETEKAPLKELSRWHNYLSCQQCSGLPRLVLVFIGNIFSQAVKIKITLSQLPMLTLLAVSESHDERVLHSKHSLFLLCLSLFILTTHIVRLFPILKVSAILS